MPLARSDRGTLQRWTFLVLFAAIAWLFWRVAEPLAQPLFIGALVATAMHPLHKKLTARIRGPRREAISAFLVTSLVMLIGLLFLVFFSAVLLRQILGMAYAFAERTRHENPNEMLGPRISEMLASVGENPARLQEHVAKLSANFAGHLGDAATSVLAASASLLFLAIFTSITSYYLIRNGERFGAWLVMVLPLPDGEVRELERNFRDVARAMLMGTGATALYQGFVSWLGYLVAGVPHALVWGALTGFASILPAIGTTIIWAPAVIWLFAHGHVGMGVALLLWSSLFVVGVADYILRPRMLRARVKMNELVIFIAIFGGLEAFGIFGTILGPIIAALLTSMIEIYLRDYRPVAPGVPPAGQPSAPISGTN